MQIIYPQTGSQILLFDWVLYLLFSHKIRFKQLPLSSGRIIAASIDRSTWRDISLPCKSIQRQSRFQILYLINQFPLDLIHLSKWWYENGSFFTPNPVVSYFGHINNFAWLLRSFGHHYHAARLRFHLQMNKFKFNSHKFTDQTNM